MESKLDLGVNEPKVVEVSVEGMLSRGMLDILYKDNPLSPLDKKSVDNVQMP